MGIYGHKELCKDCTIDWGNGCPMLNGELSKKNSILRGIDFWADRCNFLGFIKEWMAKHSVEEVIEFLVKFREKWKKAEVVG